MSGLGRGQPTEHGVVALRSSEVEVLRRIIWLVWTDALQHKRENGYAKSGAMDGRGRAEAGNGSLVRCFFEPTWSDFPLALSEWTPSLDLSETKDALVVKVEVPGMDPKEIQVSLQENLLTVKGEKKQEKGEKVSDTTAWNGAMGPSPAASGCR
jgi:hypothetical protein